MGIRKYNGVEKEALLKHAEWVKELNKSGYAGVNEFGIIVDRRDHPDAVPIQKNSLFGVVEPKELPDVHQKEKTKQKIKAGKRKGL